MITQGLMEFFKFGKIADIIVDPKPMNGGIYNGVYMITPNEKEWAQMLFSSTYTLNHVKYILETKGSKGMVLMDNMEDTKEEIPADPVEVYNVSGAGDTVIAVMSTCLSLGLTPIQSAKIANKCAGYVVTQPGTSVVPKNIFMRNLKCVTGG
jgi:D-beta-D-heptose 7-phosphate kinase/D-beta-D-heptose 1-phosphate adenosyltransferase